MIKKNIFRFDSRQAPALWVTLFHRDSKPAASTKGKRTKPAEDDSAAEARRRMIERSMNTDRKHSRTNTGIQKGYGGACIDK